VAADVVGLARHVLPVSRTTLAGRQRNGGIFTVYLVQGGVVTVRIRFTSANPYIIYTYLEFPLGLYAFTKLVLRLGIDGVVTSTA